MITTREQAEQAWKDGDYVVAVLPQTEEDTKPIYVMGYEDCARDMRNIFIDEACEWLENWCKHMSVLDSEDIAEFRDAMTEGYGGPDLKKLDKLLDEALKKETKESWKDKYLNYLKYKYLSHKRD